MNYPAASAVNQGAIELVNLPYEIVENGLNEAAQTFTSILMRLLHIRSSDLLCIYDASSSSWLSQVQAEVSFSALAPSSACLHKFMYVFADTGRQPVLILNL